MVVCTIVRDILDFVQGAFWMCTPSVQYQVQQLINSYYFWPEFVYVRQTAKQPHLSAIV